MDDYSWSHLSYKPSYQRVIADVRFNEAPAEPVTIAKPLEILPRSEAAQIVKHADFHTAAEERMS